MRKIQSRFLYVLVVLVLIHCLPSAAQVATGSPPFTTAAGGPDLIDLANLNVQYTIPIFNKAGRGHSFAFNLSYDTSVYYRVTSGGTTTWQPVNNWGWQGLTEPASGSLTASTTMTDCPPPSPPHIPGVINFHWSYRDTSGVLHRFPTPTTDPSACGSGSPTSVHQVVEDGSGFFLAATGGSGNVTSRGGLFISGVTTTDRNGNEITSSGGQFFDTLSLTIPVLTISGNPPANVTYVYPSPAGSATITIKYLTHTVLTDFGCSGVGEYSGSNIPLVSEIDLPDSTKYLFTYEATPGHSGDVTGRLASLQLPTGGTISYAYTGSNNGIECTDGSTAGLTRTTPDGQWTYSRAAGTGAAYTTTVTDPQGNATVVNFQGLYETERQVYQGPTTGTLLKTTNTCYNGNTTNCTSTAITQPITQRTVFVVWPDGVQGRSDVKFNSNGLVTETDEYAYGTGAPGALTRKTLTTYATLTNNIENMPASVTVQDGSGNTKSQTSYTYDQGGVTATTGTPQQVAITGSRGNATTISYLVSGSTTLMKTFSYYDTGNVNVATDVNGAMTTYNYGSGSCGNSFATSVSEPLSLSKSITWNCTGGVETGTTDENSQSTTYSYTTDADFWRPNSLADAASNTTNFTYTGANKSESALNFNGAISTVDMLTTRDSLGRSELAQRRQSQSSGTYDSVETDYDSLGRPSRITLPYAAGSGVTNPTAPSTQTTYDALGRKLLVTDSGSRSVSYTYPGNDVYRTLGPAPTGESTKRKQFEYDALGRLTSVCEVTSAPGSGTCAQTSTQTGYWTQYTYDTLNNLVGVTQNAQSSGSKQTRTFAYDDMSRMTSETNPESATTTYTFDSDATCGTSKGDLVKKVDAVGNTTCLTYDALHRPTAVTYSGTYSANTPNRYFAYDSATVNGVVMANVKGRMAEAYTCLTGCASKIADLGFSYSVLGQPADVYESTPHSGGYYHVTASYWANGVTNQLKNLVGLPTITYAVDGEGRITSASAGSGQNPLSSTSYNTASEPTQVNLGSSDSDGFTYDTNTNRPTQYNFNVNGQSVTGTLTWNAIGTLQTLAITDPFYGAGNQTCNYTHDDESRIAAANCGSPWAQTFNYDAFGNLSKSGTVSFQPTYSYLTNHITQIGTSYPTYDANGNVLSDTAHTYVWDANGKPVTVDGAGLTYDALGRMVEQNKSGVYTEIAYAPGGGKLAVMSGTTLQKAFVPLAGGAVAVYNSSGLAYYRHPDWLGSSRFASTPARAMYFDGAYAPFGETYAQTGTTDLSFTGMNQDTVASLFDFPAREYNGIHGRWPSPDPSGSASVSASDPQSWNRYAYTGNSPMSSIDPTGMAAIPGFPSGGIGGLIGAAVALGFGSGPATDPGTDGIASLLASTNVDTQSGSCVYLNAAGTGVDQQYGNGFDANSNRGECGTNGGYFAPGYANPATLNINPDGGFDPNTTSAVTIDGMWDGSLYNLTMFAPGALGAFGQAPSQLLTPDQCNQMNQGLTRLNTFGSIGIGITSAPFVGPWGGFFVGSGTGLAMTGATVYLNQKLCGGPSF